MAPEILATDGTTGNFLYNPSEASDIWSMGVTIFAMCYGSLPLDDGREDFEFLLQSYELHFPPSPLRDRDLETLIRMCMQRDPSQRPSVAMIMGERRMIEALEEARRHRIMHPASPKTSPKTAEASPPTMNLDVPLVEEEGLRGDSPPPGRVSHRDSCRGNRLPGGSMHHVVATGVVAASSVVAVGGHLSPHLHAQAMDIEEEADIGTRATGKVGPPMLALTPPLEAPLVEARLALASPCSGGVMVPSPPPLGVSMIPMGNQSLRPDEEGQAPGRGQARGPAGSSRLSGGGRGEAEQLRMLVEELLKENNALKQALAVADPGMAAKFGVAVQIFDPTPRSPPRAPLIMAVHPVPTVPSTMAPEEEQGGL